MFAFKMMFLLLFSSGTGLIWNMGSDFGLLLIYVLIPGLMAIITASLHEIYSFTRKILLLIVMVFLCNAIRTIAYVFHAGSTYVTGDISTQLVIGFSLIVQVLLACFIFWIIEFLKKRLFRK